MVDWNDNLLIGVLEVDVQHKLLFDKFNGFLNAYQAKKDQDEIMRMFWFLEAYAVTHFNEEEKLMQQVGFPDYLAHRDKHQAFIEQVNELKERIKVEGFSGGIVSSMTGFITNWLINHISTADRAIGQFINSTKMPL